MTSSRQGGPSQGRGNPSDQASDQRLALLSATLSEQIIPRLLQAHIYGDSAADGTPNYSAQTGRPISSADVKDLVRVVEAGTVQAQENPLTNLLTFSLWRHHPHVSLTGHFFGLLLLVCPRAWHEALDDRQRRALDAAVAAATSTQRALAQHQDETALTALRAHGVQVLPPQDLDMAALRAATTAVSQALRARLPTELVQAYLTPTLH